MFQDLLIHLPVLLAALGFVFLLAMFYVGLKNSQSSKKHNFERSLLRVMPSKDAAAVIENSTTENFVPVRRTVTLLSVNMVGLSNASDSQAPDQVFSQAKDLIQLLKTTMYDYDGTSLRQSPEGILCFFGLSYEGTQEDSNHVETALKCALQIQRENAAQNIAAEGIGKQVIPFCIGIHTASVAVGNLGDNDHFELGVIGSGVNFVERLSLYCEKHSVMVSATSHALLVAREWSQPPLIPRTLSDMKSGEPIEAYECDALTHANNLRDKATKAHRTFTKAARVDERWPIPEGLRINSRVPGASGTLLDFSKSGFALEMEKYFAVGSALTLTLESPTLKLGKHPESVHVAPIVCEVRWARALETGKYLHGVFISKISKEECAVVIAELTRCVQAKISSNAA